MQQNQLALSEQQADASSLVEIVLPGDVRLHLPLILPILSQLTYGSGRGWLTYVGTTSFGQRRQLSVPMVVTEYRDGMFETLFVAEVD